jgi:hypothetical protein
MTADDFRQNLLKHLKEFKNILATDTGDWVIKGFIDIYRKIYTISSDTKVVSKIIELMLFPVVSKFAAEHNYSLELAGHQNHYPDISFIAPDNTKFALDIKTTYRKDSETVNGFTLGAFDGYFRKRKSKKNITFPYDEYAAHFILGVIYSRNEKAGDEFRSYKLEDLESIASVVQDFDFLIQEKWRIAGEHTGSGNTKNIGSIINTQALINGSGPFSSHGQDVFDHYWMNYLTEEMAQQIDSEVPYSNLKEYWEWRNAKI